MEKNSTSNGAKSLQAPWNASEIAGKDAPKRLKARPLAAVYGEYLKGVRIDRDDKALRTAQVHTRFLHADAAAVKDRVGGSDLAGEEGDKLVLCKVQLSAQLFRKFCGNEEIVCPRPYIGEIGVIPLAALLFEQPDRPFQVGEADVQPLVFEGQGDLREETVSIGTPTVSMPSAASTRLRSAAYDFSHSVKKQ